MKIRGALLIILSLFFFTWNASLSTQRKNLTGSLAPVKRENVEIRVSCPGKMEPKIQDTIRAEVDGKKKMVSARVGDQVTKGQKLMEISDSQIRIELTQKQTSARNARADMIKAKKDMQLERSLYSQQAVPKRDVENAVQTYERALQSYTLAEQELALTEKKAKAVNVFATMNGVILKAFPDEEEYVSSGKELFKIAQMDAFLVKGNVDELDISQVEVGQDAVVRCDAFAGVEMSGRVARIGAQAAEGAFAEIEVLIEIVDAKGIQLKPNLTAEASIVVGRIPNALVIPSSAVRRDIKGTYVLVSQWGGWLQKQPVAVVKVTSGQAVIADGLSIVQSVLVPKDE